MYGLRVLKAVVLAGGLGKRLRPLTEDRPKILVEVCGRPIIEWHIYWLKRYGFNEFVLLLGHAKEKVISLLGSGRKYGARITYVVEDEPLGTAGAIKNAEGVLRNEEWFLVLNGDVITDLNPLALVEELKRRGTVAVMALVYMRSPYGVVKLEDGIVKEFVEKPQLDYTINAGVYAMTPKIFSYLPERGDVEVTAFPKMASEGVLRGVVFDKVLWKSIDTIKDLEECEGALQSLYPDFCTLTR